MVEYSDALGCPLCASFSSNHILSLSPLICPEQVHGNMESAYCVNSIVASITKKWKMRQRSWVLISLGNEKDYVKWLETLIGNLALEAGVF